MDNRFELAGHRHDERDAEARRPRRRVGQPRANRPRTLYIRQLDRPADGFRYEQVGSRPRVNTALPDGGRQASAKLVRRKLLIAIFHDHSYG